MDRIEKLLKEIKGDSKVWEFESRPVRYSGKFLDTVGGIFEKYGFGVTKTYLLNQAGRDRYQAMSMKRVIDKMEQYPEIVGNRAIGRYVIKTIQILKTMEV